MAKQKPQKKTTEHKGTDTFMLALEKDVKEQLVYLAKITRRSQGHCIEMLILEAFETMKKI